MDNTARRHYRHIAVHPVAGALGAEVRGVDIARPLEDEVIAEVRQAFLDHLVVFIRDQKLTPQAQLAFAQRFGQPMEYPQLKGLPECPLVTPVVKLEHERVNFGHTARFRDWTEQESAPLLDYLFMHQVKPEFTCRFHWEPGSLAFWDNRCAQHYPVNDYHGFRRVMHRVTLAGDTPR